MEHNIEGVKSWLASNGLYAKSDKSDDEIIQAARMLAQWTKSMQQMQSKRELNEIDYR